MCLLFLGTLLLLPRQIRAAPLDPDDAMLFDIRLDELRMGNGAHGYQTEQGICVDFGDVASALDVAVEIAPDRQSAAGWVFDEHALLSIDRTSGTARVRGLSETLSPGSITDTKSGWCILVPTLAHWFGLSISADTLNALLLVHSDKPLPAQRALARSAQAELLDARISVQRNEAGGKIRSIAVPYRVWRTPSMDVAAEAGARDGRFGSNYEVFAAGEALWMSVEARLASDSRGKPNALRARFYRNDPDARLLGPLRATEVAVGDVSSFASRLATHSAAGRGLSLTNRPLGQASQFDTTSFEGDLPSGWDVELFRNGELIGVSQGVSGGRYRFLGVPLVYGSNLLEIVRHGPQGQVRRERHVYEVGQSAVPPGRLWWWADTVQKNHDMIGIISTRHPHASWRGDAGVEYGLDKRTSVAVSLHSLMKPSGRHRIAEAELRRALGTMTATLTGARDLNKGHAVMLSTLGRAAGFRFNTTTLINRGLSSDLVDKLVQSSSTLSVEREVALGPLMLPIHFDLGQLSQLDGSKSRTALVRTSVSVSGISATLSARAAQSAAPSRPYGPIEGGAGLLMSGRIGRVTMRGEVNYKLGIRCAFSDARATGQWALSANDSWQAGLGYSWETQRGSYVFGYSHSFRQMTLSANLTGETGGAMTALLGVRLSIGPDARGHLRRVSSDHLASSGSLAVTTYRDINGDGVRQHGEPLEEEANLLVNNQPAKRARQAQAYILMLDGLATASSMKVGIDPASLTNPLLNPAEQAVRIVPRKGLVTHLDMGVAASGVIDGYLRDGNGNAVADVAIILRDASGKEIARSQSDFDGSFVFEKIRYGSYLLTADASASMLRTRQTVVLIDDSHPSAHIIVSVPDEERIAALVASAP